MARVPRIPPPRDEIVYAAELRCRCGAGMAYRPRSARKYWACSEVLLGRGAEDDHTPILPWRFHPGIVGEGHPLAKGHSTRPRF